MLRSSLLDETSTSQLNGPIHIQYFVNCLKKLPQPYSVADTNRLTLVHFATQSLDILGFFDNPQNLELYNIDKQAIIDWIYSLRTTTRVVVPRNYIDDATDIQIPTDDSNSKDFDSNSNSNLRYGGFKGGTFLGPTLTSTSVSSTHEWNKYDDSHIAMTYVGLCTLATLGDDLTRVDRESIIQEMKDIQLTDGSFKSTKSGSENDMRFVYCACAVSHMLNDWTGMDIPKTLDYIRRCRTWDGGIGLSPGKEGHGGSTFCATASLSLMGKLEDVLEEDLGGGGGSSNGRVDTWRNELIRWCVSRQVRGMQGRPNKHEDTCYSYWIGGSLRLLGCEDLLDLDELRKFVLECQTDLGGFSKLEGGYFPDLLHSFYSLAWLSVSQPPAKIDGGGGENYTSGDVIPKTMAGGFTLNPLDCTLGLVSKRIHIFQTRGSTV